MSLAMRAARQHVGDPGIFSFIGKAIGTVAGIAGNILPGPLGTVAKLASGILTPKPISIAKATVGAPMFNPVPTSVPQLQLPGSGVSVGPGGVQIGTFGSVSPAYPASTGPLVGTKPMTPCVSGHHFNKSTYYTKKYGVVQKGTVCVRNRRRNPLNPRALSRAMSRVASAQKAVKCLKLFAGAPARASAKKAPRKKGCKTCR